MLSGFADRVQRKLSRVGVDVRRRTGISRDPIVEIARIKLFDLPYYRAQFPRGSDAPATIADALEHYISEGRSQGLSFHPFVEPEWWAGRGAASPDEVIELENHLIDRRFAHASPTPLLAEGVGDIGEMVSFLTEVRKGRRETALPGGISTAEARDLMIGAVSAITQDVPNDGAHSAVDWQEVRSRLPQRIPGRVSIVVATYEDWNMTVDAVRAALSGSNDADVEIIVVDNGSRPAVFRMLAAVFLTEPRVRVVRSTANTNFSGGMNIGIARSTGEYVLLLNNDAMLEHGWLSPLVEELADPDVRGVQSLLLYPHIRRIQAAGTMFLGEGVLPWHFLAGHPLEDFDRVRDRRFGAITAAVMMLRASELVDVEGFDEAYRNGYEDVDLCLRLSGRPEDHFTVARDSRAVHPEGSSEGRSRWDNENRARFLQTWRGRMPAPEAWRYTELGIELAAMRPHAWIDDVPVMDSYPHLVRPRRAVAEGPAAGLPCLRWAFCLTTMPAEERLLTVLQEDLEALGQETVSFAGGARFTDSLDDVVVAFAPDAPFAPRSATVNVLVGAEATPGAGWDATLGAASADRHFDPGDAPDARREVLRQLIVDAEAWAAARFGRAPAPTSY